MSLLDKLENVFKPQATVGPSEKTWPDATNSEYWDDTSINKYELPPVVTEGWAPTDDKQMPGYRGVESHGVPFDASQQYIIPLPQDVADANEAAEIAAAEQASVAVTTETIMDPIPVTVVEMPEPIGRENRVATSQWPLNGVDIVQIAPKSRTRERLVVKIVDAGTVFISTNKEAASMSGYPITAVSGDFELETTSGLFAWASTPVTVYVLQTYSTQVDEHVV